MHQRGLQPPVRRREHIIAIYVPWTLASKNEPMQRIQRSFQPVSPLKVDFLLGKIIRFRKILFARTLSLFKKWPGITYDALCDNSRVGLHTLNSHSRGTKSCYKDYRVDSRTNLANVIPTPHSGCEDDEYSAAWAQNLWAGKFPEVNARFNISDAVRACPTGQHVLWKSKPWPLVMRIPLSMQEEKVGITVYHTCRERFQKPGRTSSWHKSGRKEEYQVSRVTRLPIVTTNK